MMSFTNQTYDEIQVGATITVSHKLSKADTELFAFVSGDVDTFVVEDQPSPEPKNTISAEALGAEVIISAMLNRRLPGPGTIVLEQNLKFEGFVSVGDEIAGTITAIEKRDKGNVIVFDCIVKNEETNVITGTVTVSAPTKRISFDSIATPEVILRHNDIFAKLLRRCGNMTPVACAVVHPCDRHALLGPLEAAKRDLINPVLVGPKAKILAIARQENVDITPFKLVDVKHSHEAAIKAVTMARNGEVQALMKGSLHTDELMAAVVPSGTGLRTDRRISHIFVLDVPAYPQMLMITDAAINVAPNAREKADIAQNAIELANALGVKKPRVAILAAVETVNPDMPATVDAAVLCKMADRGQITGGILDGPLAFDNAISLEAARTKKIVSPVAGKADILLAPDLEAGNMVAKQLQYLAGADSAGIVVGTKVPIVLTSRADTVRTRLASIAVMALFAEYRRKMTDLVAKK
jgi:phosphate acetyltransferase